MADDFDPETWILELIERPLEETVAEMAERVRQRISLDGNGEHSPVGGPPYLQDGTLGASVGYTGPTTTSPMSMEASFGAGPAIAEDGYDYSADIELGTGKMTGPRPYVLNRADEAVDLFIEKFTND